jgi:hypothetical protein
MKLLFPCLHREIEIRFCAGEHGRELQGRPHPFAPTCARDVRGGRSARRRRGAASEGQGQGGGGGAKHSATDGRGGQGEGSARRWSIAGEGVTGRLSLEAWPVLPCRLSALLLSYAVSSVTPVTFHSSLPPCGAAAGSWRGSPCGWQICHRVVSPTGRQCVTGQRRASSWPVSVPGRVPPKRKPTR